LKRESKARKKGGLGGKRDEKKKCKRGRGRGTAVSDELLARKILI